MKVTRLPSSRAAWLAVPLLLMFAAPGAAQDPAQMWNALAQAAFDPGKSATVENVALARDRIRITLSSGTIQFSQPVNGVVFGAAFRGRGKIQIEPPDAREAQQLSLFLGRAALNLDFTDATFSFTDDTYAEIAAQVRWGSAAADYAALYNSRQEERENVGAEIVPRLFRGVFAGNRRSAALFAADLKTDEKGWLHARFDASDPEEILVGRWVDWGGVKLLDTWMHFPAGGRSASEVFVDPLRREPFVIRGYKIDATIAPNADLRATSRVALEPRLADERILLFEFDAKLRVESVKNAQGASLPFFQPRDPKDRNQSYGDYLAVALPQPLPVGQAAQFEISYAGKRVIRKVGSGNFFCQSYGWYPTRPQSFATRADFELNFRSPKRYTLIATGQKLNETRDGDWIVSSWKSERPLAVAGFAFGDFKTLTEKAGTVDVNVYANRDADEFMASIRAYEDLPSQGVRATAPLGSLSPAALAKTMAIEVANTVRLFEKYFGPFPYSQLSVTNIPYTYGQGWPTLLYLSAFSFIDSTQRQQLGITDHIEISDFFRAHESSHQWWGHKVSWKSYHDQWLSEGFAQFSGNLYVQYRRNPDEYLNRIRSDKQELYSTDLKNRRYESLGPVWMGQRLSSADSPRAYSVVVYNKGGLILHMLRMMVFDPRSQEPDERFIRMMQEFTRTFENRPASTEDFKAVVEKYMTSSMDLDNNKRLDWFFRQYVYGTGIPTYQFTYRVADNGDGKWRISVRLTQSGVPEGWLDCIPLYIRSGQRTTRLGWISVREKESTFHFLLPSKPDKLFLNFKEDTLAEIKQ